MGEKLAVIIPAHNAADKIEACLQSIAAQSHKADALVLIDDASGDGTALRATQAATALGLDLKCLRNETRQGVEVINQAVDAVEGDLLVIFRPEDRSSPQRLERLAATAHSSTADLIVSTVRGPIDLSPDALAQNGWPEDLHPGAMAFRPRLITDFFPLLRKLSARRWDWSIGFRAAIAGGITVLEEALVETTPWGSGLDRGTWAGGDLALIEEEMTLAERTTQFNYLQLQLRKYRSLRPEAEQAKWDGLIATLTASLQREGLAWAQCRNRLMLAGLRPVWSEGEESA